MSDGDEAAPKWARTRGSVWWSLALGEAICARVADGELLYQVLAEPGMPTPQTVGRWARDRREFGRALAAARRKAGRLPTGGGVWTYCQPVADEVFERLCEGESLTSIGADPTMPCLSTLFHWRRRFSEFNKAVLLGKEIQAERLADEGWEMVRGATPETAYLTHVRLTHLRWMTGVMAPRAFRVKQVEPHIPKPPQDVLVRTFSSERNPETGMTKVVCWCPNPETGLMEREDIPGWTPPEGAVLIPN